MKRTAVEVHRCSESCFGNESNTAALELWGSEEIRLGVASKGSAKERYGAVEGCVGIARRRSDLLSIGKEWNLNCVGRERKTNAMRRFRMEGSAAEELRTVGLRCEWHWHGPEVLCVELQGKRGTGLRMERPGIRVDWPRHGLKRSRVDRIRIATDGNGMESQWKGKGSEEWQRIG